MTEFVNETAYNSAKSDLCRKVKVTVEIALDCVPGWGDNVEDHIRHIFLSDPYVVKATVEDAPKTDTDDRKIALLEAIDVVETELEYPSALSTFSPDLQQLMRDNPIAALQTAVCLTKASIKQRMESLLEY